MDDKFLTHQIIGAAIEVHEHLGPGLLESSYESALVHELKIRGLQAQSQFPLSIKYKDLQIPNAYRIDLLVNNRVIVEVKAVDALKPIHNAQILTYLQLANIPIGLLMNFHEPTLIQGLRRFINGQQK